MVFAGQYACPGLPLNWYHPSSTDRFLRIVLNLLDQTSIRENDIHVPSPIDQADLSLIHSDQYLSQLANPEEMARQLEFPALTDLSAAQYRRFIDASLYAAGGTLLAARLAIETGVACNIGGGFHHAKPRYAEGFCLIADIPIAIRRLQIEKQVSRVMVVDLDVHQGNGTIVCLEDDPRVFTYSIHQAEIYPSPKEEGSMDIALPYATTDETYLSQLKATLPEALTAARPDLVFLVAGVDTLEGDPLASLCMTPAGVLERDSWSVQLCRQAGVPVVITLAGGYREDAWQVQAQSIARVLHEARAIPPIRKN